VIIMIWRPGGLLKVRRRVFTRASTPVPAASAAD